MLKTAALWRLEHRCAYADDETDDEAEWVYRVGVAKERVRFVFSLDKALAGARERRWLAAKGGLEAAAQHVAKASHGMVMERCGDAGPIFDQIEPGLPA
jgi:hypothetical protein